MADLNFRIVVKDDGSVVVKKFGKTVKDTGRQTNQAASRMTKSFDRVKSVAGRVFGALTSVQGAVVAIGGAAALRAVGAAVNAFTGFEKAMLRVKGLTGATQAVFERLSDVAKKLGQETQFSAQEAAGAMGFLAQAGFDVNEVMEALPGTLELAASAQLDLATTADIVTNVLTGMNLEVSKLGEVNDVLVATFTNTNVSLVQLGESFKFVGPIAASAGVEFNQVSAALGLMGNAGIQATLSGTALRGAISRLLNPGKQAAATLSKLEISAVNSAGKLASLTDIVKQLEESGATTTDILKIFGQRAGPGMAALVAQGSGAMQELVDKLDNAQGTAGKLAETNMGGLQGALTRLKSAATGALIELGEALAPALTVVAEASTAALNAFTGLIDGLTTSATEELTETQETIKRLTGELDESRASLDLTRKFGILYGESQEDVAKETAKFSNQVATLNLRLIDLLEKERLLAEQTGALTIAEEKAQKATEGRANAARKAAEEAAATGVGGEDDAAGEGNEAAERKQQAELDRLAKFQEQIIRQNELAKRTELERIDFLEQEALAKTVENEAARLAVFEIFMRKREELVAAEADSRAEKAEIARAKQADFNAGIRREAELAQLNELDRLIFFHEERLLLIGEDQATRLAAIELFELGKKDIEERIAKEAASKEKKRAAEQEKTDKNRATGKFKRAQTLFGGLAQLAELGGSKMFAIGKKFAKAEAVVNIAAGATQALRLPFPANLAALAQTLVAGKQQLASLDSASPGGGGSLGGGGGGGSFGAPTGGAGPDPIQDITGGAVPPTVAEAAPRGGTTINLSVQSLATDADELIEKLSPALTLAFEERRLTFGESSSRS